MPGVANALFEAVRILRPGWKKPKSALPAGDTLAVPGRRQGSATIETDKDRWKLGTGKPGHKKNTHTANARSTQSANPAMTVNFLFGQAGQGGEGGSSRPAIDPPIEGHGLQQLRTGGNLVGFAIHQHQAQQATGGLVQQRRPNFPANQRPRKFDLCVTNQLGFAFATDGKSFIIDVLEQSQHTFWIELWARRIVGGTWQQSWESRRHPQAFHHHRRRNFQCRRPPLRKQPFRALRSQRPIGLGWRTIWASTQA
jgi:hypothetical protein